MVRLVLLLAATAAFAQDWQGQLAGRHAFAFANEDRSAEAIERLLANPSVDGIVLGGSWDQVEPRDDGFDWSRIDEGIDLAAKHGKRATIHLFGVAFGRPPSWLEKKGAQFYSYEDFRRRPHREPVPWDRVFLDEWTEMITALARHLAERKSLDTLFAISLTVPAPEMSLIAVRDGNLAEGIAYDRKAYLDAWKRVVEAYEAAFPRTAKLLCAPVGEITMRDRDARFFREVMNYALEKGGDTFWMFATDLNAEGSRRTSDYLDYGKKTTIGYQTIDSATGDGAKRMKGTLQQAVDRGLLAGARYFEVYAADVLSDDPEVQKAIESIRKR